MGFEFELFLLIGGWWTDKHWYLETNCWKQISQFLSGVVVLEECTSPQEPSELVAVALLMSSECSQNPHMPTHTTAQVLDFACLRASSNGIHD